MDSEKRRFSRVFFEIKAQVEINGDVFEVKRINNLSVGGCLVDAQGEFERGSKCVVTLFLPRMEPGVEIDGEIVRIHDSLISIQFIGISPENLFHLQNIVRHNAKDPDKIEEEIERHPGLK